MHIALSIFFSYLDRAPVTISDERLYLSLLSLARRSLPDSVFIEHLDSKIVEKQCQKSADELVRVTLEFILPLLLSASQHSAQFQTGLLQVCVVFFLIRHLF